MATIFEEAEQAGLDLEKINSHRSLDPTYCLEIPNGTMGGQSTFLSDIADDVRRDFEDIKEFGLDEETPDYYPDES